MNEATRLLVVAPHPDDDVIGCGGTMRRVAQRGGAIGVVYVTDGAASHPRSRRFDAAAMRTLREREARAALALLAPSAQVTFCCLPDGRLASLDEPGREAAVARLGETIRAFAPNLVLAPWRRDPHPDHRAATALVRDALRAIAYGGAVAEYGVWLAQRGAADDVPGPSEADAVESPLDAATLALKRRAILAHASQFGGVIDDDPDGFRIDERALARWLAPVETFYADPATSAHAAGAVAC